MNIGIDITPILYRRGVSRYTNNLVLSLLEYSPATISLFGSSLRQHLELEIYTRKLQKQYPGRTSAHIGYLPPQALAFVWNRLGMYPISRNLPNIDVFHSWDWVQPPDFGLPLVSTIHDLAMLRFPESAHSSILHAHQQSWKKLHQAHAQIIAVSNTTKQDIIELLNIEPSNVHVIYEALPREVPATSHALTDEVVSSYKTSLQLTMPYFLCVGTREPRKNLLRTIQAWEQFADQFQLIIVGEHGWDGSEVKQHPHLRFLGRVSDTILSVLYSEASLFLYPSLYEGFGLPILEAFHYGVPVVTSNNSGMKEVAGNAAELIDPLEVESIIQGINRVLEETEDAQQRRMQKMVIRLHMFDWRKTAQATLAVYQKAIQHKI